MKKIDQTTMNKALIWWLILLFCAVVTMLLVMLAYMMWAISG